MLAHGTSFVPPQMTAQVRLIEMATAKPWLAALAERLTDSPPEMRSEHERIMANVFKKSLYDPGLSYDQAKQILDHSAAADDVIDEEFDHLLGDETLWPFYRIWASVWEPEQGALQRTAQYFVALLARLYRLRYFALREVAALDS